MRAEITCLDDFREDELQAEGQDARQWLAEHGWDEGAYQHMQIMESELAWRLHRAGKS